MTTAIKSAPKSNSKKSAKKSAPVVQAPVVQAPVVRQRSQRVTIFSLSLTSVLKTLGRDLHLTSAQAQEVVNKLADNDASAIKLSTITTALSDGRSEKYSLNCAVLSNAQLAQAKKIASTVAPVAQAPLAPQAVAPVKKSAKKSASK